MFTDSTIQLSGVFRFRVKRGDCGMSRNLAMGPVEKLPSAWNSTSGSNT